MALTLSTKARNAACNAVVDLTDEGTGAGKLKIKVGAVVLCTFTLEDPAFEAAGTAAAGQARAFGADGVNPVSSGNPLIGAGLAAGDASSYEVTDSDDEVMWSGTVTATGGGGDLTLDNVNIAIGQEVRITSWTHTQPA